MTASIPNPGKDFYFQLLYVEQWAQDVFALNPDIKSPEDMHRRYTMAGHLAGLGKALPFLEWAKAMNITVKTGEDDEALEAAEGAFKDG